MASTYLSKTFGTATNRKKWTFSAWIKRSTHSVGEAIFSSYSEDTTSWYSRIADNGNGRFDFTEYSGSAYTINLRTNALQRDVNGWYHIVWMYDSAQATASDRVKYYINGEQITSWSVETYPSQNQESGINKAQAHAIGKNFVNPDGSYFNGSMSHIHFTDGYAYEASAFGEYDATTGIWKPITEPSVTYGTNGFFLKFENSGSMGTDSSPNTNNFTVNGTLTQTVDTPSNVFTTWNPLENYYQSATLSNGNTTIQTGNSQYSPSSSTLGVSSGKWYWEVEYDALSGGSDVAYVGVLSQFATNSTTSLGTNANDYGYYVNGNYYNNNTGTAYGTTYTTGDIIGVALDLDNNKLYFSKNGTWQNSGDPESGATGTGAISITNPTSTTNGAYFPSICDGSSSANATFKTNFGNGYFGTTPVASAGSNGNGSIFEFDCPSGYYALNTKNINTYG
jgi:hypothetical protein